MVDRETLYPPSSRDVGEEFLYHLHRGSELLQSDRMHDAQAELEQALAQKPRDPKGQDLLAVVYFRLGLYPRAISIYEGLVEAHPEAVTPRVNLGLCYLKTGQAQRAREVLERVLELAPKHGRAWGYLGLALQRLGEHERAGHAFTAGGHDALARRALETATATASASLRPSALANEVLEGLASLRGSHITTHAAAHVTLPASAERPPSVSPDTSTSAGLALAIPPLDPLPALRIAQTQAPAPIPDVEAPPLDLQGIPAPAELPPSTVLPAVTRPRRPMELLRETLLVFPRDLPVSQHSSGLVLVRVRGSFAARLAVVRSFAMAGDLETETLPRRHRGRPVAEPLGGAAAPLLCLKGNGELTLAAPEGHRLVPLLLEGEPLYLRESALAAFDPSLTYEYGRLPLGDGEAADLVLLRGNGDVVLALPKDVVAVEATRERAMLVRGSTLVGWLGRLVPRALPPSEAPGSAWGFVSLLGEGMVFIDGR
jgi:uncharacterized protein (AIM24 family)